MQCGFCTLIGGALALHPMIVVKDGKMDASRKYRGKDR